MWNCQSKGRPLNCWYFARAHTRLIRRVNPNIGSRKRFRGFWLLCYQIFTECPKVATKANKTSPIGLFLGDYYLFIANAVCLEGVHFGVIRVTNGNAIDEFVALRDFKLLMHSLRPDSYCPLGTRT